LTRPVVKRARNGLGLFAARPYAPNERIMKIVGRIVDSDVLWERGGKFADNCYRFGPETYLDPADHPTAFVNHACRPNAAVGKANNQLFLFAARPIPAGKEILIDYSTILGDDDIWTMRCNCGLRSCRGIVKRFGSLPPSVKQRYLASGLVPNYIIKTLRGRD
jgi:SET domain-containing protein